MASNTPIETTSNKFTRMSIQPATHHSWSMSNGMNANKMGADDIPNCRELLEEIIKINTPPSGQFYFPGVTDDVEITYKYVLQALESRFAIEDYFPNNEIAKIVKAIDNHDYVKDVYPDTDVGWHGLMLDAGIFIAIARFKKQHDNPHLVSVERVCSALTIPMPKHLYYLTFKFEDGSEQTLSYRSGDEILHSVST